MLYNAFLKIKLVVTGAQPDFLAKTLSEIRDYIPPAYAIFAQQAGFEPIRIEQIPMQSEDGETSFSAHAYIMPYRHIEDAVVGAIRLSKQLKKAPVTFMFNGRTLTLTSPDNAKRVIANYLKADGAPDPLHKVVSIENRGADNWYHTPYDRPAPSL